MIRADAALLYHYSWFHCVLQAPCCHPAQNLLYQSPHCRKQVPANTSKQMGVKMACRSSTPSGGFVLISWCINCSTCPTLSHSELKKACLGASSGDLKLDSDRKDGRTYCGMRNGQDATLHWTLPPLPHLPQPAWSSTKNKQTVLFIIHKLIHIISISTSLLASIVKISQKG